MSSLRDVAQETVVLYIYYMTAAGNAIGLQLGSSVRATGYGTEKAGCTVRPSHLPGNSSLASQAGRRVGPANKPLTSLPMAYRAC